MTLGAIKKVRLSGKGKWYTKKVAKIDDIGGGVRPENDATLNFSISISSATQFLLLYIS